MAIERASASPHSPQEIIKIKLVLTVVPNKSEDVLSRLLEWTENEKKPTKNILYATWQVTKLIEPESGAI